jgi:dihydropteroate synthase
MGVVNVTPDSFSDGGRFLDAGAAIAHGRQLLRDGADILDVGGEATNPKATPISADEELSRVLPVVEGLAAAGATVSIDTTKAVVAAAAVRAGARIVNDVSGGLFDSGMREVLAGVTYICGHLRGRSIAEVFTDENRSVTWQEVAAELAERLVELPAGVDAWVDPGIGFGKGADPATNLELLRHAGDLGRALGGRRVVVGPSRKRFLARWRPDLDADAATVAACREAAGADVLRVHNVALLRTTLTAYNKSE